MSDFYSIPQEINQHDETMNKDFAQQLSENFKRQIQKIYGDPHFHTAIDTDDTFLVTMADGETYCFESKAEAIGYLYGVVNAVDLKNTNQF